MPYFNLLCNFKAVSWNLLPGDVDWCSCVEVRSDWTPSEFSPLTAEVFLQALTSIIWEFPVKTLKGKVIRVFNLHEKIKRFYKGETSESNICDHCHGLSSGSDVRAVKERRRSVKTSDSFYHSASKADICRFTRTRTTLKMQPALVKR